MGTRITGQARSAWERAGTRPAPPAEGPPTDDRHGEGVAALLAAAACGQKPAWDLLVDRFAATVWDTARSYGLPAEQAAEVSRTTWLRLLENLGRIEAPDDVGSWLAATARRESLRAIRLTGSCRTERP